MPRCRDGLWCIDDLCHFTDRTLCGIWTDQVDEAGDDYDDDYDDDPAVAGSATPTGDD